MTKAFEVRIQGELGEGLLRLFGWSHRTVPAQTLVRVVATPADLQGILLACTERGLRIERVRRLGGPPNSDRRVTSTEQALDLDVRRRLDG